MRINHTESTGAHVNARLAWRTKLVATILVVAAICHAPSLVRADDVNAAALGVVDVDGSAGAAPPPRLAVLPVVTTTNLDSTAQLVLARDLELSGQFRVVADDALPRGPFTRTSPVDLAAFRAKAVDILVKVTADEDNGNAVYGYSAWLVGRGGDKPVLERSLKVPRAAARMGAHAVADDIMGALTGRPGSFVSRLVYTRRVGEDARAFALDADGFGLHEVSPPMTTALSPDLGPKDVTFFSLSEDSGPFRIVSESSRTPLPLRTASASIDGSVLGMSFSSDRTELAVTVSQAGASHLFLGRADGSAMREVVSPPLASHPTLGPLGKLAWTAGAPPRVYVNGRAVSPAGYAAADPVFCDSPRGLLVVFSLGFGRLVDLFVVDAAGSGLARLTQGQGANVAPACSPDGRSLAFFSTRASGPGLYVMPLDAPSRAHRISELTGESLRWRSIQSPVLP